MKKLHSGKEDCTEKRPKVQTYFLKRKQLEAMPAPSSYIKSRSCQPPREQPTSVALGAGLGLPAGASLQCDRHDPSIPACKRAPRVHAPQPESHVYGRRSCSGSRQVSQKFWQRTLHFILASTCILSLFFSRTTARRGQIKDGHTVKTALTLKPKQSRTGLLKKTSVVF